jgi:hypothetical protein
MKPTLIGLFGDKSLKGMAYLGLIILIAPRLDDLNFYIMVISQIILIVIFEIVAYLKRVEDRKFQKFVAERNPDAAKSVRRTPWH